MPQDHDAYAQKKYVPDEEPTDYDPFDDGRPVLEVVEWKDLTPTKVSWLWEGRLPRGKVVTLAGDPGLGKTTLTCAFAAHVTRGKPWPDGAPCEAGQALFISAEDDPADTLLPRFLAHGGDKNRIATIGQLRSAAGRREFDLTHVDPLADLIAKRGAEGPRVRLIIIDPITAYLGEGNDGHNNAQVRALLKPLCELAQFYEVCILTINHFNKNSEGKAIYRTMGSQAFVAAARTAHGLIQDPDDPSRRLWLPIKNNLGQDRMGLAFRIQSGRIAWEADDVDRTEYFKSGGASSVTMTTDAAVAWLKQRLGDAQAESVALREEARSAGIGSKLFERARNAAGLKGRKGAGKKYFYYLPDAPPPEGAGDPEFAERDKQRQLDLGEVARQRYALLDVPSSAGQVA